MDRGEYFSKKGISMSFNWIFAIIAGVFILFFAIYFASKFIQTGEQTINTETAAKLISYFSPLESGFSSGLKPEEIVFKKDTRVFFSCNEKSNLPFGKQTLSFSEKSLNGEYGQRSLELDIKNKYIFTEGVNEKKKIIIFSKPFSMGFLVGDVSVLISEDYCFFKAPNDFFDSLNGISNIKFEDNNLDNCSGIKVCFSEDSRCDIVVKGECNNLDCETPYDYGTVINRKKSMRVSYIGNLAYGGIFSSSQIYECNVKRLMSRFNELEAIYLNKIKIMQTKGCYSKIEGDLKILKDFANKLKSSKELVGMYRLIKEMEYVNKNSEGGCRVY